MSLENKKEDGVYKKFLGAVRDEQVGDILSYLNNVLKLESKQTKKTKII